MTRPRVAIVHDYLTQYGGAERVVLELARAFPDAPVYTSVYAAERTYAEFGALDVRTSALDRAPWFRAHHRAAFPFLAPVFSAMRVDAEVVVCSSSGWAHGVRTTGRKVVYCHAVARWLAQPDRYVGALGSTRAIAARTVLTAATPALRRWDARVARSADRYLANSAVTRAAVRAHYGIEAHVLHPPTTSISESARPVTGLAPGFFLAVTRLLPYKNVGVVAAAFERLPEQRLLVVGDGPERERLRTSAPANVEFRTRLSDGELRWCYEQCAGLVAASHEDFGLTVLEAAAAGRPVAALRAGGYLETVRADTTGVFFDAPTPLGVADAIAELRARQWDPDVIRAHAAAFAPDRFRSAVQTVVGELLDSSS
jgi:glycosyltransferase involved in cell wall biosynthesis